MSHVKLIQEELERRMLIWSRLKEGGENEKTSSSRLRQIGIYGGAQGIWVNKTRTHALTSEGVGVAVGLLNTSSKYADETSDEGVVYHYPQTDRPTGRDRAEINALKAAAEMGLPVFVIDRSTRYSKYRSVQLGWVLGCDDANKSAWVEFSDSAPPPLPSARDDSSFVLDEPTSHVIKASMRNIRHGQAKFKYRVFERYGVACPFSGIMLREVLDAAHVKGKADGGSDDPRNGLVLASHIHRAWDAGLFGINPQTLIAQDLCGGSILEALSISPNGLVGKDRIPHRAALQWKWDRWRR